MNGNVTLGKNKLHKKSVVFLQTQFLISHIFPPTVYTELHVLPLQQTEKMKFEILPSYRTLSL